MNKKILLINMGENLLGISVRYLSSWLKENGFSPTLLYLNKIWAASHQKNKVSATEIANFIQFIKEREFSYVGFSLMTCDFYRAKSLTRQLKEASKNIVIIWGGIHPSLLPQECIEAGADFVVLGEGEASLKEILDSCALSGGIPTGHHVISRPSGEKPISLDSLPFPDYDFDNAFVLDYEKIIPLTMDYYKKYAPWNGISYPLTTSRGCPYSCAYCCNMNKHNARRRSVNNIMEELLSVKKILSFTKVVNIYDDCFFLGSDDWLEDFSTQFKTKFGWPFFARLMPRFVTEKRIDILKKGGLHSVIIGLQGSDRLNREYYNRHETCESFIRACHILAEYGIGYKVDVLIDNPYETKEDIVETIRTLNEIPKPYKIAAYGLTLFPRTGLKERAEKEKVADRFGTDPYISVVQSTIPGKYATPSHWVRLMKSVDLTAKHTIDKILQMDIDEEKTKKYIDKVCTSAEVKLRMTEYLKKNYIFLYNVGGTVLLRLRGMAYTMSHVLKKINMRLKKH